MQKELPRKTHQNFGYRALGIRRGSRLVGEPVEPQATGANAEPGGARPERERKSLSHFFQLTEIGFLLFYH